MILNKNAILYLILSTITFFLTIMIIFFSETSTNFPFIDRIILGLVFILSCILGVSFAIYPGWLSRLFKINRNKYPKSIKSMRNKKKYRGHHPDCDKFRDHVVEINEKDYCSGCLGLTIGLMIAIILMIVYLLSNPIISYRIYLLMVFFGIIIIMINFFEILFKKRKKIVHLILNILLIVSFFLITISIFEITGKLTFGFITIIFSFLWIDTRAQLSFLKHRIICLECKHECKMY